MPLDQFRAWLEAQARPAAALSAIRRSDRQRFWRTAAPPVTPSAAAQLTGGLVRISPMWAVAWRSPRERFDMRAENSCVGSAHTDRIKPGVHMPAFRDAAARSGPIDICLPCGAAVRVDPEPAPLAPEHVQRKAQEQRLLKAWETPTGWRYWSAVNNQHVGLWYTAAAFVFFLFGGALALLMRIQLAFPNNDFLSAETLQPDLHGARLGDDVSLRRPDLRGVLDPDPAADARRARSAVSAAVGVRVLELRPRRRLPVRLDLLRRRAERRLVHVPAADLERISRTSAPTSGCSGSRSSKSRRSPRPSS